MTKKTLCIICNKNEATVKDRNEAPFGKRNKLCMQCHTERLRNDLVTILVSEKRFRVTNT